jgi:hypothetical protein
MAKYFDKQTIDALKKQANHIVALRNQAMKQYGVDLLDTDAISSLFIYEIVSQYDPNYNINFSRNGEDAQSKGILIEQKATKVNGPLTKTGKRRKNADIDAVFQFHAMGDLDYPRYLFVARNKDDLSIMRIYDIGAKENTDKVLAHLMTERDAWLERSIKDKKLMKRDIIQLPEKFILENLALPTRLDINGCVILKD